MYKHTNLLDLFRIFLDSKKNSRGKPIKYNTIRNYLSDIRHFLFWLQKENPEIFINKTRSCHNDKIFLPKNIFLDYIVSLFISDFPIRTIKRRISALISFIEFTKTTKKISTETTAELVLLFFNINKDLKTQLSLSNTRQDENKTEINILNDIYEILSVKTNLC